jgi:hypothetical protein
MPEPVEQRPLVVFLTGGRDLTFPEANAYAFTGPNDRDLELFDRDWEQHVNSTRVYSPTGAWSITSRIRPSQDQLIARCRGLWSRTGARTAT